MNSILIVCDTLRRDHLGCYGNPWIKTPNLDRLARMGTVFDNHYCASFPTLPCRRDIATGKIEFPWRGWGGLEREDVTLAAQFETNGKIAYLITDVHHHWGKDAGNYWGDFSGFELIRGQELDRYITDADLVLKHPAKVYVGARAQEWNLRNAAFIRRNEEDWFAPQLFTRAGRWIQHNAAHNDFFLMIDGFDPHEPWDPPRHYADLYYPDYKGEEYVTPSYRPIEGYLTPEEFRRVQALYAGEVTMVDGWFGRFLDQVESLGLLKNTIIILTTDHGTYNGDHGQVGKLQTHMFQGISRIPLIIYHPQYGHGERRGHLSQPIDFFPTICGAAGLKAPEGLHGRSLLPILKDANAAPPRDAALFGRFGYYANVTDGRWTLYQPVDDSNAPLYCYSTVKGKWTTDDWGPFDGRRRLVGPKERAKGLGRKVGLFDLVNDPDEENDLAGSKPGDLERMQRVLVDKLSAIDAPRDFMEFHGLGKLTK